MSIYTVRNATALDYIVEHLIPADDYQSAEHMKQALQAVLLSLPDQVNYQLAEENDTIIGFLLAYKLPDSPFCEVIQSYIFKGHEKVLDYMFMRLLIWCDQQDIKSIRMGSKRNDKNIADFWNMQVAEVTWQLEVRQNMQDLLLQAKARLTTPETGPRKMATEEIAAQAEQESEKSLIEESSDVSIPQLPTDVDIDSAAANARRHRR